MGVEVTIHIGTQMNVSGQLHATVALTPLEKAAWDTDQVLIRQWQL
jgi:hypothetical protein